MLGTMLPLGRSHRAAQGTAQGGADVGHQCGRGAGIAPHFEAIWNLINWPQHQNGRAGDGKGLQ